MINKKLIHFNEHSDFEVKKNNNEILDTSIVFIKDANKIYTHSTEYQWVGWNTLMLDIPEGQTYVSSRDGALKDSDGPYLFIEI